MNVKIFRQRISQAHESEVEINEWLAEMKDRIEVKFVEQSPFMSDNTDNAQPGYVISVWYERTLPTR